MRRFTAYAALGLLIAASTGVLATPAFAANPTTDFTYTVSGTGATINSYIGTSAVVDIPGIIFDNGTSYPVTALAASSFRGNLLLHAPLLTSVNIPNSVTTIGDNAFQGDRLTSLVIPDSVTTIGSRAFYNNGLTSLTLGNAVSSIANNAFNANLLTAVTIPASVTSIGNAAFIQNFNQGQTLTSVIFAGSAPAVTAAGPTGSFAVPEPTLYYYAGATGFSALWNGYPVRKISASTSSLVVPSGPLVADGLSTATATVTVRDDTNSPVPGVPVVFTVPVGAASSATGCTTATDGTCAVSITSTRAGTYAILARIGSDPAVLSQSITFTAVPSAPLKPELAATGASVNSSAALAVALLALGFGLLGALGIYRRKFRI